MKTINLILIFVLAILILNAVFILYVLDRGIISGFVISNGNFESPSDFLNESSITANNTSVTFFIEKPSFIRYEDSGSMAPTLGVNSTGVVITPKTEGEVNVGDIVTFRKNGELIVHRVIEKNYDGNGVYFVTKGDNNNIDDGKIRLQDIESVLVAVIY
ncbi:MAG: signal peptidase I [Nanoarchaeota archaeon]